MNQVGSLSQVFSTRREAKVACSSLTRLCLYPYISIPSKYGCSSNLLLVISSSHSIILAIYNTGRRHLNFVWGFFHVYLTFYGIVNSTSYTSNKQSLQPMTRNSTTCPKFTFYDIASVPRSLKCPENHWDDLHLQSLHVVYVWGTLSSFWGRFIANLLA